jgi:hypothetical protein
MPLLPVGESAHDEDQLAPSTAHQSSYFDRPANLHCKFGIQYHAISQYYVRNGVVLAFGEHGCIGPSNKFG